MSSADLCAPGHLWAVPKPVTFASFWPLQSPLYSTNRELYPNTHPLELKEEGMRRNCRFLRIIAGFSLALATLCLFQTRYALAQTQEPPKQTPEVEQLKQRLQQLEQTVLELKDKSMRLKTPRNRAQHQQ